MKKLLSALLTLALLLGCACASAETQTTETNLALYEFDDFTMTFDADMVGSIYEKAHNEVYFQLYPFYDENATFTTNINCVWSSSSDDLTQVSATDFANLVLDGMLAQFNELDINAENAQVLLAEPDELDGKYALCYLAQYELEGMTVYLMQVVVSDAAFGTYTFSATFDDPSQVDALAEIVTSVKWTA